MLPKFKIFDKVKLNRELGIKGYLFKKDTIGEVVGVKGFMCRVKMQDDITKQEVTCSCYEGNLDYIQTSDFDSFDEELRQLLRRHHAEIYIGEKDIDEQGIIISINSGRERRFALNDKLSYNTVKLKRLPKYMQ